MGDVGGGAWVMWDVGVGNVEVGVGNVEVGVGNVGGGV